MLMREAAKVNDWTLNNAGIAAMWRGGCIIKVSSKLRAANPLWALFDEIIVRLPVGHYRRLPRQARPRELARFALLP
jgi:hypothetical protein